MPCTPGRHKTLTSYLPLWHYVGYESDYVVMVDAGGVGGERRIRRWRSVAEKRRIVGLTWEPGASVALVARANGVNTCGIKCWFSAPTYFNCASFTLPTGRESRQRLDSYRTRWAN